MLRIENLDKLRYYSIGKDNFYVESVRETFDMDGALTKAINHKYEISITNRRYGIIITLERKGDKLHHEMVYKLISSTGHIMYVMSSEIRNMDVFIEKLKLVALSNFK